MVTYIIQSQGSELSRAEIMSDLGRIIWLCDRVRRRALQPSFDKWRDFVTINKFLRGYIKL